MSEHVPQESLAVFSRDMAWSNAINQGVYADLMLDNYTLRLDSSAAQDQRMRLEALSVEGMRAQTEMTAAYLGFAGEVIFGLIDRELLPSFSEEDMAEATETGLEAAVRLWEPNTGERFADFAEDIIYHYAVERFAKLHLLGDDLHHIQKVDAAIVAAWQKNGGEKYLSILDVVDYLNIDKEPQIVVEEVDGEIVKKIIPAGHRYVEFLIGRLNYPSDSIGAGPQP